MEYAAPGRSPPGRSLLSEGRTGSERWLPRLPCMRWICACKSSRSEAGEAEDRRDDILQFSNIYSNESIGVESPCERDHVTLDSETARIEARINADAGAATAQGARST